MKILTKNKRALFDYEIQKEYQAGIVLKGYEVKALKTQHSNIQDAVVRIDQQALRLYNMDIPLYAKTAPILAPHYDPKARRKLLLTKREIAKIASALDKPGMVLIALESYVTQQGLIKVKLGLGKLRKKIEKKQILKERAIKKQMDKDLKHFA